MTLTDQKILTYIIGEKSFKELVEKLKERWKNDH